jgi:hypothetical protein
LFALLSFDYAVQTLIPPANTAESVETQEQVVAAIKKLGGTVTIDKKSPNKTIIGVDLSRTKVTDNGLIEVFELFKLRNLYLVGTEITDYGLENLRGLAHLRHLNLDGTKVTDEGMIELSELLKLQNLNLSSTKITDNGMGHLE